MTAYSRIASHVPRVGARGVHGYGCLALSVAATLSVLWFLCAAAAATPAERTRTDSSAGLAADSRTAASWEEEAPLTGQDAAPAVAQEAYALWEKKLTAMLGQPDSSQAWREFLGLNVSLGEGYRQLGMAAYEKEEYRRAAELLALARDFNPDDLELTGRLGFAYKETGEYEKALVLLHQAVAQNPSDYYYWWWLSDTQRLLGAYAEACQSMRNALSAASEQQVGDLRQYLDYTEQLADTAASWDNFQIHCEFARRHEKKRRGRRTIAEYVIALGLAPAFTRDDNTACLRVGWVNQQIGAQYRHIQEPEVALAYLARSIRYYGDGQSNPDLMRGYQNMALAYDCLAAQTTQGSGALRQEAATFWLKTIELASAEDDLAYMRYAQGSSLATLVALYPVDDERVAPLREQNVVETPWRGPVNEYTVAEAVMGELACRLKEGDWAGARILIEMVQPFYDQSQYLSDNERGVQLRLAMSRVLFQQAHYRKALEAANDAAVKVDDLRQYTDAAAFNRGGGARNLRSVGTAMVRASLALDAPEQALESFERCRNQSMVDLAATRTYSEMAWADVRTEKELLVKRIPVLKAELEHARDAGAKETPHLDRRIASDKTRLTQLEYDAPYVRPADRKALPVPTLAADDIKEALPETVTLVCYTFDAYGGVALVVSRDSIAGIPLDGAAEPFLSEKVQTFHDALEAGTGTSDVLGELYDLLIEPVRPHLRTPLLYIAAEKPLERLPFEMLGKNGNALIDEFEIAYVPDACYLAACLGRESAPHDRLYAVARGERGLDESAGVWAGFKSVERFTGEEAGEARVLAGPARQGDAVASLAAPSVMHIACPADLSPVDSTLSALLLAPGAGADGRLHAAELLTASVSASLVVMDLEIEAREPSPHGRAYDAFVEGWRHAGVPAIIMNLWTPPAESSAALFTAFYKNLGTMSAIHALTEAKRVLRQGNPGSPDWAAFVLYGDYR